MECETSFPVDDLHLLLQKKIIDTNENMMTEYHLKIRFLPTLYCNSLVLVVVSLNKLESSEKKLFNKKLYFNQVLTSALQ